jgi:hypothetical protein
VTSLAEAAADAYLSGWALTDAPFTPRVEAGCLAAVQTALDFPGDPGVLEATMHLGHGATTLQCADEPIACLADLGDLAA